MRGRWDHVSPEGHQDRPRDNTSRYAYAQASRWLRTDELIHPEIAMEIASWWTSPGRLDTAITAFASHGDVKIHGIGDWESSVGFGPDLSVAVRVIHQREVGDRATELSLAALVAYVDAVEDDATQYRQNLYHGGNHRWMGTDTTDRDSCLTCGVLGQLRPDLDFDPEGHFGSYYGGDGKLIIDCTGCTDLVHGYERICEGVTGRGCDAWQASSGETCEHVDHTCNCLLCN